MADQDIQAEWGKFGHLFRREEIPAKTVLLSEGEIAKKVYFIEKGCLRLSFNKDSKEKVSPRRKASATMSQAFTRSKALKLRLCIRSPKRIISRSSKRLL